MTGILILLAVSLIFLTSRLFTKKIKDLERAKEELEKANAELKKIDKLKSEFISTIAHDLRTPLSIAREGVNLVLDGIGGKVNEKQKEVLITSRRNIDRLTSIINSLLDMPKMKTDEARREAT